MLLELTVRALERPDAQQVAIARRVGEWITGRDFTPNEECRMLRTKVLARVAQLEAIPGGIPTKRAGAKTGDNRSGRRSEKRKQKKEGKAK